METVWAPHVTRLQAPGPSTHPGQAPLPCAAPEQGGALRSDLSHKERCKGLLWEVSAPPKPTRVPPACDTVTFMG